MNWRKVCTVTASDWIDTEPFFKREYLNTLFHSEDIKKEAKPPPKVYFDPEELVL